LSDESASEVEQQLLSMKNKNKRLHGLSSMIHEDSDTSSDEINQLIIFFFIIAKLLYFLIIGINIFQQKKIIKGPKIVMAEQTTVNTLDEYV